MHELDEAPARQRAAVAAGTASTRTQLAATFLHPKSLAIVGASAREGGWSGRILRNLEGAAYPGDVYLVNPRYDTLAGRPCYPDLRSLPEVPDQIVVIVPAAYVLAILEDAVALGVRSCIIFSGGFGEDGTPDGHERGQSLRELVLDAGIALCGPNCLGYASYPARSVVLTEREALPVPKRGGNVALVAQSGGVAMTVNRQLLERAAHPRYVVSSGNELGLTVEDWLEYFIDAPTVDIAGAFIETIKDPDRFIGLCTLARERGKPLVIAKLGSSREARQAVVSHTGRVAGSELVFSEICSELGVITVRTVDEMVDTLSVFRPGKIPASRSLGGVTVSGGLRAIFLDSAHHWSMEFPPLHEETSTKISGYLGVGTAVGNPIDSGWSGLANNDVIIDCVRDIAHDAGTGAVLMQGVPGLDMWPRLDGIAETTGKLIVFSGNGFSSSELSETARRAVAEAEGIAFCSSADRAIAALRRLAEFQDHAPTQATVGVVGPVPANGHARAALHDLENLSVGAMTSSDIRLLDENEAKSLIERYGIRVPRRVRVDARAELGTCVQTMGVPAVLKVISRLVPHKAELGLISPFLMSPDAAASAFDKLCARCAEVLPPDAKYEIWLEEVVLGGVECAVGISHDVELGQVMMFGTGGLLLEAFRDLGFALPVTSPRAAERLIARTKIGRLLLSSNQYDIEALFDLLARVGELALEGRGFLTTLDLNPITVLRKGMGVVSLDASATVHAELPL